MRHHKSLATMRAAKILALILLVLAALLFFAGRQGRAASSVSASLNPTRFSVGDSAVLTVNVNGSSSADVQIPRITGLSIQNRGQSTRVQMINGSFSSSVSYSYIVIANRPGNYTIPPIKVVAGGATLSTGSISLQVTQAGAAAPANPGSGSFPATRLGSGQAGGIAFLRVNVQKDMGWVGQDIPVRIKAYFPANINASLDSLPLLTGDSFVMRQLKRKPLRSEENVNGRLYSVLTWNSSISAIKAGHHSLSLELDATLQLPTRGNPFPGFGGRDPFRGFFNNNFFQNFFNGFKRKKVKITSRPITINTKPLPLANQPPEFSGAIGRFKLQVTAKPDTVNVGDPVTLDMIVSGNGNFDRVQSPKFPKNTNWKHYPSSSNFTKGNGPTQGKKTFEMAIIARNDRPKEIPSVSFVFFDPTSEKYVTLESGPIPITVRKSASSQAPTPATPAPAAPAAPARKTAGNGPGLAGLAPIHLNLGRLQKTIVPLYAQTWFGVTVVLCVVLLIIVFVWQARIKHLEKNPDLVRKRELKDTLTRNMARVSEAAGQGDSRQYLVACRRAIQEALGRHWQMEPSAITLADLQARLAPSSGLTVIFQAAEQDAYAGLSLSVETMREYSEQLQKELSRLQ